MYIPTGVIGFILGLVAACITSVILYKFGGKK